MPLPEQRACDLLQLAVNCGSHATAAAAAAIRIPAQLEPGVACRLLLTAAVRAHPRAYVDLMSLAAVKQSIDAVTCEAMIRLSLVSDHSTPWGRTVLGMVRHFFLCQPPATSKLEVDVVVGLLRKAFEGESHPHNSLAVTTLCALPAAQQLGCEDVRHLLQAAARQGSTHGTAILLELPAVQQLSSHDVALLLRAALQAQNRGNVPGIDLVITQLISLPAAQRLPRSTVESLLSEVGEGSSICISPLQQLLGLCRDEETKHE